MGNFKYYIAASLITAVALFVCQKMSENIEPEVMTEDAWWGHQSERTSRAPEIRPFQINITDKVIGDLKNKLSNARPLVKPLENVNFEYGFNSDQLTKIVDHWVNRYDWTARQAYLNTMPQYKTRIYGLDLHFIHAKPRTPSTGKVRTVPLLMLHGWPGSVVEFYKIIPMLTEPRSGDYDFVFEVIAPSLPGYGFSDAAVRPGMGPAQMGQVFVKLMERLGHKKFYVQGGDWGAVISEAISKIFPDKVYGMHSNMCTASLTLCNLSKLMLGAYWPSLIVSTETEKSKVYPLSKLFSSMLEETGYMHLQMTKPDTAGVALNDSPVGLAAYILEKFSTWSDKDFIHLSDGGLSKYNLDELLDNVMVYWVTNSMTTSMRLYSEFATKTYQSLPHINAQVQVPTACALFPNEIPMTLPVKKLLQRKYVNLVSSTEIKEGGHFAAFEQPKLLSEDIWSSIYQMETIKK